MAKPKPNYYAVARGRHPGIYRDWSSCSAQVTGFSGSRSKGHATLEDAKQWMRECNAEQDAVVVDGEPSMKDEQGSAVVKGQPYIKAEQGAVVLEEQPSIKASSSQGFRSTWKPYGELSQEFKLQLTQEIQASQGHDVKPKDVQQVYERRRTREMHNILHKRFFKGSTSTLEGYRNLCRAIRIEPSDTIPECRADLRSTLVNIVDLLDALGFNEPVRVWQLEEWAAFTKYTREPANCFDLEEAKRSKYLKCFLQKLGRKEPYRFRNPRPLQTVADPDPLIAAPISPIRGAEVEEETRYEGIGRLSPLASECTYEHDEDPSPADFQSIKRSFRDMEDGRVDGAFGRKRSRLMYASQVNAVRFSMEASEEADLEDFEDTIPSGQGDE